MMVRTDDFTNAGAVRFFVPLFVQGFFQCLTYPLVASIVSSGPLGVAGFAAFAQGQVIMFLIGAVGAGLVTTGMVYGRTRSGLANFGKFNLRMALGVATVQVLASLPPFSTWIFEGLLNLPPELASVSAQTLGWGVFMNLGFFLRNVPLVVMFNDRSSAEANVATLFRVAFTAACPIVFRPLGLAGPMWGLVAQSVGVFLELGMSVVCARHHAHRIAEGDDGATIAEQFRFTVPLSLGGLLLAAAPFLTAAFIDRSANAVEMLAVHSVVIGIVNPFALGVMRTQTVAVQYPPSGPNDRRVRSFSLKAGAAVALLPLVLVLPGVRHWYFAAVQNLPPDLVRCATWALVCYLPYIPIQALRGEAEGAAAREKDTRAVMCGQLAYLLTLVSLLALTLALGVPGWLMPVVSITSAALVTNHVVRFCAERRAKVVRNTKNGPENGG